MPGQERVPSTHRGVPVVSGIATPMATPPSCCADCAYRWSALCSPARWKDYYEVEDEAPALEGVLRAELSVYAEADVPDGCPDSYVASVHLVMQGTGEGTRRILVYRGELGSLQSAAESCKIAARRAIRLRKGPEY